MLSPVLFFFSLTLRLLFLTPLPPLILSLLPVGLFTLVDFGLRPVFDDTEILSLGTYFRIIIPVLFPRPLSAAMSNVKSFLAAVAIALPAVITHANANMAVHGVSRRC